MRLEMISENITESAEYDRCVRTYRVSNEFFGSSSLDTEEVIRVVIINHAGEWWQKYIILPRTLINKRIRYLRYLRKQYHDLDWWQLMPETLVPFAFSNGPGRGFAREPYVWKDNRHHRVVYHSGGLDI